MPDKSKLVAGFFVGESPKGSGPRVTLKRMPDGGIEMSPEQLEQLLKDAGKVTEIRAAMAKFVVKHLGYYEYKLEDPVEQALDCVHEILEILERP
jgi:hypothetical protein